MTITEFSNEFDVLYNNITSNQAPGLDEYEKSVFLTKAQDEIVKAYFDPLGNKFQEGFDGSEKRQIDFSMLMKTANGTPATSPTINIHTGSNAAYYTLPSDILLYINEVLVVTRGTQANTHLTVVPISYVEYNRLMSKPFKRPLKNQAWRLINNGDSHAYAELIPGPNDTVTGYIVRYVSRPEPIILADLTGEQLSLGGGVTTAQTCKLDPILHEEILQRAVELAKAAYQGSLESQIVLG